MPSKKPNISELIDDIKGNKLGGNTLLPNTDTHLFPDSGLAIKANALQPNISIVVGINESAKERMQQILEEKILTHQRGIVITTKPRTLDEHSAIQGISKPNKSLHNLPQAYHNPPTLTNKRDTADGLQGNSVDDKTAHFTPNPTSDTYIKSAKEHIEQLKETVFPYTNPYAEPKQLSDVDYYKQNAEVYLKEYLLIQQKISKLSSTKRRKIVYIVETFILPNTKVNEE